LFYIIARHCLDLTTLYLIIKDMFLNLQGIYERVSLFLKASSFKDVFNIWTANFSPQGHYYIILKQTSVIKIQREARWDVEGRTA